MLVLGLPFAGLVAGMLERLLARSEDRAANDDRLSALNVVDLSNPQQAISNATREVLAVCDKTEVMLNGIFDLFERWDAKKMERIATLDDQIDTIHRDIKFYLARISETALDQTSAAQCQNLLGATIKIEQAADIISQNMLTRARKKSERNVAFSARVGPNSAPCITRWCRTRISPSTCWLPAIWNMRASSSPARRPSAAW